jgi:hypothetical protein
MERRHLRGVETMPRFLSRDTPYIDRATTTVCLGIAEAILTAATAAAKESACRRPCDGRRLRRIIGLHRAWESRPGLKGPDRLATRPGKRRESYDQHHETNVAIR